MFCSLHNNTKKSSGFSLIEVLIALLVSLLGLLGIAALQVKAQQAEMESYQRAQALIMMADIVDRMNINRSTVSCFVVTTNTTDGSPFIGTVGGGVGHFGTTSCTASTAAYNTQADAAIAEIDNLLQGAAESMNVDGVTVNTGAMIGARACISYDATTELGGESGTGLYTVVVSWQAMGDLDPPSANCGNGLYGAESKRRAVSTTFRIANLFG
jgi:type IV pilus assembly protein PilV